MMPSPSLYDFAKESNEIERIYDASRHRIHADALFAFLDLPKVTVMDVEALVKTLQPEALLRDKHHLNVRVGGRMCPAGGPAIKSRLKTLLKRAPDLPPRMLHVEYELLHPFTDGNGRSSRALWLWCMQNTFDYYDENSQTMPYGFLQMFYYQTLSSAALTRSGLSDKKKTVLRILNPDDEEHMSVSVIAKDLRALKNTVGDLLNTGPLNRRAMLLLLHDALPNKRGGGRILGVRGLERVLEALEDAHTRFCREDDD